MAWSIFETFRAAKGVTNKATLIDLVRTEVP